ncbi:dipeptide epimerase, partial [Rhizobiaceae sp. 2RAB30]
TMESVRAAIETQQRAIEAGIDRRRLRESLAAGAARNALDCALWDLEAKLSGRPAWKTVCQTAPKPLVTAYTLSLGEPEAMAAQARANAKRPLLKVKIGGDGDI